MSAIEFQSMAVIQLETLQAYAHASGDHNLIHLDDAAAKKVGLPGVIAHGMLIAGFLGERAERFRLEELGAKWTITKLQFRFKAMTFLGDEVFAGGQVKEQTVDRVVLDLIAKDAKGEIKTLAHVEMRPH